MAVQLKMFNLVKLNIDFIDRRPILFTGAYSSKLESAGIERNFLVETYFFSLS